MTQALRIPAQFKLNRPIESGPFGPWVANMLRHGRGITREMLEPTQEDLALISSLAYQTDELGDALAALIMESPSVARQLEQGLARGVATLENPPEVLRAFLDYYENPPDWSYRRELEAYLAASSGEDPSREPSPRNRGIPRFMLDGLAMAVGFFVGANYPAVGQSIALTGSVSRGSERMAQTMQYVDDVTNIRGFVRFGSALQSSAKVRLAHAFARHQIKRGGLWDEDYYGSIISQFDNMIFLSGLTLQDDFLADGDLSPRTVQAMRIRTKAMQYCLGAPRVLVTMPAEDIKRFFVMVVAHLDDSPVTARQVVRAFHENAYFRKTDTVAGKAAREASFLIANLITRTSWGNRMADDIGLAQKYKGVDLRPVASFLADPPKLVTSFLAPLATKGARTLKPLVATMSEQRRQRERRKSGKPRAPSQEKAYKGSFGAFAGVPGQAARS